MMKRFGASGGVALRQMRQVDERRQRLAMLADQLRDARIEAEATSEAKSVFLADMSHELRTPLHSLSGMVSLLRDSPRDPHATEWLATADDSARHLERLLDDILDLSKLESGALSLSPGPVSLAALLREVQTLLQPAAAAKGLTLQAELDPTMPAQVLLDGTRVRQVLLNLLANAVKYSDAGAIVLKCRQRDADGLKQVAGQQHPAQVFDLSNARCQCGADHHTAPEHRPEQVQPGGAGQRLARNDGQEGGCDDVAKAGDAVGQREQCHFRT